jgi:ribA/ribD-fused uncharacterized protein
MELGEGRTQAMPVTLDLASLRAACVETAPPELLFFWGHKPPPGVPQGTVGKWVFSQWYPAAFTVDGIKYATSEHWMMAGKAAVFGDREIMNRILADSSSASPDPGLAKRLGRQVSGFDQAVWLKSGFDIVTKGNVHKFGQNLALGSYLLGTGEKVLVEASPHDRVWGIGLNSSDPRAQDPRSWDGENLLGFALMKARHLLAVAGPGS